MGARSDPDDDQPTCHSRLHEPGKAPVLSPGAFICPACRDLTETALVELPALFALCAHAVDLRPPSERPVAANGHRPHGVGLRDSAVSMPGRILGMLSGWCGHVSAERGVLVPDPLDVRKLVGFLAVHVDWLCRQPVAAEFATELADLTEAANEALRPDAVVRTAVGACPHPGCPETVHAESHREGGRPYEFSCAAGHVWAPEHWMSLRGRENTD